MKKLSYIPLLLIISFVHLLIACSPEDKQELPEYSPVIFNEDFEWFTQGNLEANTWSFDTPQGTKPWKFETRSNNT